MRNQLHTPRKKGRSGLFWIFLLLIVVAGVGIAIRVRHSHALKEETKESAVTQVSVITPKQGPVTEELVLPSNISPWHDAAIYARTSGYLKTWNTVFGTHVKKGQLLAEIETPEIDAQLRQAEADLLTAQANSNLAQLTAKRWVALRKTDSVSKQDADEKLGDAQAKAAALASAQANRDHLKELEGFKHVIAPFDGIISSRTTDIGQLVDQGSQTAAPLFHIVQSDTLRVYTRVPQNDAARITPGTVAEVYFTDHPGKPYTATFLKSAMTVDPVSRTMLVEYTLDNKSGELLAGGYGESHFKLPGIATSIRLPVNTLIFRAEGLQVAVLGQDNKASLRKITMGRDFGNEVEVTAGIATDDRVIINPPDSLFEGQEVRVAEPKCGKKDGDADKKDDAKDGDKKDCDKKDGDSKDAPKPDDKKDAPKADDSKPAADAPKAEDKKS